MRSYAALAAFSLATVAYAFENIAIQETVQAGIDTQGTIANDIAKGSGSFDADFAYYRIYLATTPPGWGTMPACMLPPLACRAVLIVAYACLQAYW